LAAFSQTEGRSAKEPYLEAECNKVHNKTMRYQIVSTPEFDAWLAGLDPVTRGLVVQRLARVREDGHFGFVNRFDGIVELKWTAGLRVYGAVIEPRYIALYGGNKNGQSRDIRKAKKILTGVVGRRLPKSPR